MWRERGQSRRTAARRSTEPRRKRRTWRTATAAGTRPTGSFAEGSRGSVEEGSREEGGGRLRQVGVLVRCAVQRSAGRGRGDVRRAVHGGAARVGGGARGGGGRWRGAGRDPSWRRGGGGGPQRRGKRGRALPRCRGGRRVLRAVEWPGSGGGEGGGEGGGGGGESGGEGGGAGAWGRGSWVGQGEVRRGRLRGALPPRRPRTARLLWRRSRCQLLWRRSQRQRI